MADEFDDIVAEEHQEAIIEAFKAMTDALSDKSGFEAIADKFSGFEKTFTKIIDLLPKEETGKMLKYFHEVNKGLFEGTSKSADNLLAGFTKVMDEYTRGNSELLALIKKSGLKEELKGIREEMGHIKEFLIKSLTSVHEVEVTKRDSNRDFRKATITRIK